VIWDSWACTEAKDVARGDAGCSSSFKDWFQGVSLSDNEFGTGHVEMASEFPGGVSRIGA